MKKEKLFLYIFNNINCFQIAAIISKIKIKFLLLNSKNSEKGKTANYLFFKLLSIVQISINSVLFILAFVFFSFILK